MSDSYEHTWTPGGGVHTRKVETPPGQWTTQGLSRLQFMYFQLQPNSPLVHFAPLDVHPKTGQYHALCGPEAAGKVFTLFKEHAKRGIPCPACQDEYLKTRAVFGLAWYNGDALPLGAGDLVVVTAKDSQDLGRRGKVIEYKGSPPLDVKGPYVYLDTGRGAPQAFSLSEVKYIVTP